LTHVKDKVESNKDLIPFLQQGKELANNHFENEMCKYKERPSFQGGI
jgi:hypothetical protein